VLLEVKRYSEQSTTQFSLHFWPHGTRHRRLHGKYWPSINGSRSYSRGGVFNVPAEHWNLCFV
jgi:hypothetical protein